MDWLTFFSKMIWPGTLFIILIYFRNEIGLIIKRIKTAQIGSYKAEFGSQEQEIVKKSLEEVEETIRSNSPIIYESQISIESEMLKNLGGDDMAVNEHCRKNFTFILLSYSFFKVYLNIFGTQIELL